MGSRGRARVPIRARVGRHGPPAEPLRRLVGRGAGRRARESDSDFELTPSNVIDALQPDSGSDFELTALDPSDEFESTPLLGPGDSDVTAAEPGASGINLGRPSDSGINLLGSASGFDLGGGASSIELTPLSGSEIKPTPAARRGPSAAEAGDPGPRQGREGHLRRHRLRGRCAGRRRPDGAARAGQRLRTRGGRVGLRGLRHRRGRRRSERGDRHEPRDPRGGRRRLRRFDPLGRDVQQRLGRREREHLGPRTLGRRRPSWHLRPRRPSGAASGSACSGSPPSSCSC